MVWRRQGRGGVSAYSCWLTMSHTLIVTAPRCTLCMLKPTVGISPSLKLPVLMTWTNVDYTPTGSKTKCQLSRQCAASNVDRDRAKVVGWRGCLTLPAPCRPSTAISISCEWREVWSGEVSEL